MKTMGLGSILIVIFATMLASSLSFANSAPPPPSQVTAYLVSNGVNETSISEIVYHCTPRVDTDTYANEDYKASLTCSAGTCVNTPTYSATECTYFTAGYFTYNYKGQNRSSEQFNATKSYQRYYEYKLDVSTGKITQISVSNPEKSLCSTALIVVAMLMGVFAINSKRG